MRVINHYCHICTLAISGSSVTILLGNEIWHDRVTEYKIIQWNDKVWNSPEYKIHQVQNLAILLAACKEDFKHLPRAYRVQVHLEYVLTEKSVLAAHVASQTAVLTVGCLQTNRHQSKTGTTQQISTFSQWAIDTAVMPQYLFFGLLVCLSPGRLVNFTTGYHPTGKKYTNREKMDTIQFPVEVHVWLHKKQCMSMICHCAIENISWVFRWAINVSVHMIVAATWWMSLTYSWDSCFHPVTLDLTAAEELTSLINLPGPLKKGMCMY